MTTFTTWVKIDSAKYFCNARIAGLGERFLKNLGCIVIVDLSLHTFTCNYTCLCLLAGYVQGMSDLLAPLLAVMENEVDTFWCFVGFMDTVVSVPPVNT